MTEQKFTIIGISEDGALEIEWAENVRLHYQLPTALMDASEAEVLDWLVEQAPVELIAQARRQREGRPPKAIEGLKKLVGKTQRRAKTEKVRPERVAAPAINGASEEAEVVL